MAGSLVRLSPSGLLRVSTTTDSHPVQVMLPVAHGGQAAVSRAVPAGHEGPSFALRVQAVSSEQEKARQMERLVAMLTVAEAARADPATYPAVLPVLESFVVAVPGPEIGATGPTAEHELWCDVMAWCPHDLDDHHRDAGPAARDPRTVAAQLAPVLATVSAVHDNLSIVHRDITPNNVLVNDARRLLLGDWGIAHAVAADRTSTHTQMIGNRGFSLPPEMLAGDTAVGRYTDAWYLGSLLVWMLTGQPPDPHGQLPPGLPTGPEGQALAAVAQGLCRPDPRQRTDLAQAADQLSRIADPRWSPSSALTPVTSGQPDVPPYGTPPPTLPYETSGAQSTTVPPRYPASPSPVAPYAADATGSSDTPRSSSKTLAVVLASVGVLLVGLVVGALLLISRGGTGTPAASTSGAPSASESAGPTSASPPNPDPVSTVPSYADEPEYPAFTGLDAALAAFRLVDRPTCTQADPATYVPAGTQEVYRCTWPDLDAAVYLELWQTAAQGPDTWMTLGPADLGVSEMNRQWGTWAWNGTDRGEMRIITTQFGIYHTMCYYDLPYCSTVEYTQDEQYEKADSRIATLTATEAATLVSTWPS